jgi:hypothetical protein
MGEKESKKLIETMFAELSRGNGAGYLDRLELVTQAFGR